MIENNAKDQFGAVEEKVNINAQGIFNLYIQKNGRRYAFFLSVFMLVPVLVQTLVYHHPLAHKPELHSIKGSSHNKPIP